MINFISKDLYLTLKVSFTFKREINPDIAISLYTKFYQELYTAKEVTLVHYNKTGISPLILI